MIQTKKIACYAVIILVSWIHYLQALDMPQPVPGRITLINQTEQEIEVNFLYSSNVRKLRKPTHKACQSAVTVQLPAHSRTSITPQDSIINVIQVHEMSDKTPDNVTTQHISQKLLETETFWVYQGPKMISQMMFKGR